MKIAIVDDGVGAFATLGKLKYSLSAEYRVEILDKHFPLGDCNKAQLTEVGKAAFDRAVNEGCDAVVFSSIALSMASARYISASSETPLFGCEAPILHASTYTASQVLVVADNFTADVARRYPNVIALALPQFSSMAQDGADERKVTEYIAENAERFYGSFDCIALGCSSMNLYRNCFSRVFPNAQIFDSLEGVARKMRKKYKKTGREESVVSVFDESGNDLSEKYKFFIDEFCQHY